MKRRQMSKFHGCGLLQRDGKYDSAPLIQDSRKACVSSRTNAVALSSMRFASSQGRREL